MDAIKGGLKLALGWAVCRLPFLGGLKARLLGSFASSGRSGVLDELVYRATLAYWQEHEFLAEKNPDRREAMKDALMGGVLGERWAAHYAAQPLDFSAPLGVLKLGEACPVLPLLDKAIREYPPPIHVVQVGASSGRELAWLAGRHSHAEFIGTDLYDEVVEFARERHRLGNLRFEKASASSMAGLLAPLSGQVIIISSSSLQYVQPEHLQQLFQVLAARPLTEIYLQEPSSESEGDPTTQPGSRWAGNFAYAHNYKAYAEHAGLAILECRLIRPYLPAERFPGQEGTVHYLLRASSH